MPLASLPNGPQAPVYPFLSKPPDLGIRALNFNQAAPESSPYAHSPQPATSDQASPSQKSSLTCAFLVSVSHHVIILLLHTDPTLVSPSPDYTPRVRTTTLGRASRDLV